VPPGIRWLQGQHISHPKLAQSLFETLVLAIERIGYHRAKWDALFHGLLQQLGGYLELGAEMGVLLATLEVMCRGVRLEGNRIVNPLIGPETGYADYPVVGLGLC
jgi:hypothetical protein